MYCLETKPMPPERSYTAAEIQDRWRGQSIKRRVSIAIAQRTITSYTILKLILQIIVNFDYKTGSINLQYAFCDR